MGTFLTPGEKLLPPCVNMLNLAAAGLGIGKNFEDAVPHPLRMGVTIRRHDNLMNYYCTHASRWVSYIFF